MGGMPRTIEEKREYARQHRANNPERYAIYQKKNTARKLAWRKANPEAQAARKRREYFRQTYGLDIEQVDVMFAAQGSRCAACGDDSIATNTKKRHVDHCHVTGRVRGVLCRPCNLALGQIRDNPATLRALAEYLERQIPSDTFVKPTIEGGFLREATHA
jgi:hypothetical protein